MVNSELVKGIKQRARTIASGISGDTVSSHGAKGTTRIYQGEGLTTAD
jgi:hypothetical protein